QRVGLGARGSVAVFGGISGTDSAFRRVRGDLRAYLPMSSTQALALRLLAAGHGGVGGRGVPFHHLFALGDGGGLRGFPGGRFRDRTLLVAQAEWRWEAYHHPGQPDLAVEAFLFGDRGAVAATA